MCIRDRVRALRQVGDEEAASKWQKELDSRQLPRDRLTAHGALRTPGQPCVRRTAIVAKRS
eukprot:7800704-Pyramimonas_sp.AAC.1